MKNKLLWSSFGFLMVTLFFYSFTDLRLFRFWKRKCALKKPIKFDITFRDRQRCLQTEPASLGLNLNTLDEINFRGYNASNYTVLSKDGYYSTLYRISGGIHSPPAKGKRSVLFFHGFGAAAQSWIIQPGNRSLAFTLVDAGYDVWLVNMRGTSPSKNHTHLNADNDLEYWNFGMEKVYTLDLTLFMDLVLRETGNNKTSYICHSMGCAIFLAGLTDVPELNKKFNAAIFLAPSVYYGSVYNPTFMLFPPILGTPLEDILFWLMGGKVNGESSLLATRLGLTMGSICSWKYLRCGFCDNLLFAMSGADPEQMDYANFPNIIKKLQDNGPLKTIYHALQVDEACDFQRYDYGHEKNLLEYDGSSKPPSFNLSQMTVPTYIFYGENDNFATPDNSERLRDHIPSKYMKGFYPVDWPLFNHIDFLMAKDADILVYHKVRKILNELEIK